MIHLPMRRVAMALALLLFAILSLFLPLPSNSGEASQFSVPILVYHRFASTSPNPFTVTLQEFEEQMRYLRENGYQVIPLRSLVDTYLKKGSPPPPKAVVITIDDGHASVYQHAWPILKRYGYPVTLFVYPCWIGRVSYALTWTQIQEMASSGMEIGSHTYYHPNFKLERRRLAPPAYEALAMKEFTSSKKVLEEKVGRPVFYLSYPFGIHDEILERKAFEAGYEAMFTIARHPCEPDSNRGALGRYLIASRTSLRTFSALLASEAKEARGKLPPYKTGPAGSAPVNQAKSRIPGVRPH